MTASFDLDHYEEDIRQRTERRRVASEFREPDLVPVCFGIGGSYYCWLQGVNIRDYYATPELQPEVKLRGYRWEYECLRADSSCPRGMGYEIGPLGEAVVFDLPVERPDNTSPYIVRTVRTAEDIRTLSIIDPPKNARLRQFFADSECFVAAAQKLDTNLSIGDKPRVGIHPPLSAACALMRPEDVYALMFDNPPLLRQFLDKMYEAFVTYRDYFDALYGVHTRGSLGLADDNISQISGAAFRRWEMPYYLKLKERYHVERLYLHTDGPNDQHFELLADEVKLHTMDIGGYSNLGNAVRAMKGKVHIHGGLQCQDFYAPGPMTPATRRKVLEAIRLAAPGGGFELAIGGECYVGVSPEGIRDCVEFVEEYGRYPITLDEKEIDRIAEGK